MGTVYIPSHTTLFIAADSEIKASRNVDLLLAKEKEQIDDRKGESSEGAFVRVKNAEDVTITGGGRINGSGEWYVYEPRELPALVPFEIKEDFCKQLMGLSLRNVAVTMTADGKKIYDDFGEMLFTHFGISGPVVLSASSYIGRHQ